VRPTCRTAALGFAALLALPLLVLANNAPAQPAPPAYTPPSSVVKIQATPVQPRRPVQPPLSRQQFNDRINQNTLTIISGNPNGTYLYLAFDMSAVLDSGNDLRVLPVIGKGGYQNVADVLYLRGVDLGITQSNILSYLKKTGELGANIDARLTYIAKLYNEEMHVLAGPGINSIQELNGKRVNFSDIGSGTQFSTRLIFDLLGIKAQEVNFDQAEGYQRVKSGDIAATVLIAGKPTGSFGKFKLEPGMTLLPVPYAEVLEQDYFPAKLTNDDYPNLIPKGSAVDTVAVGAVLAYGMQGLPAFSDPQAPIHSHVAPRYLKEAPAATGVPNVVTAVLASYRGYDTLGETIVVFTAGAGVIALLRRRQRKKK